MKIAQAQQKYIAYRKELVDQRRALVKQKNDAKNKAQATGESAYQEEAATLELSIKELNDKFNSNQEVLDSLAEQWCNAANAETARQLSDPETGLAAEYGKIMEVVRRISTGGQVPYSDEKKLMEYSKDLYLAAKEAGELFKLREKKKYDSLWDDEETDKPDSCEVADNTEAQGELPKIPDEGAAEVSDGE